VNDVEAMKWFEKSAAKGHADSQYQLAMAYRVGKGVMKDEKKVIDYFAKAAEQKHSAAAYELGMIYLQGVLLPKDDKRAAELFLQAANAGDRGAQYQLALCYRDGKGVAVDKARAYAWLKVASIGGSTEIMDARDKQLERLTPQELADGQQLAEKITQSILAKDYDATGAKKIH
ncbi:MAG TPA: tetratricopeptide repeat protein, partial [Candidatus Berkiella sp.]|nr:tetratricopeptide repeat protein [Candidatus Berkiella sp.]